MGKALRILATCVAVAGILWCMPSFSKAGPQGDPYGVTWVTRIDNVTLTSVTVHWEGFCGSSSYAGSPNLKEHGTEGAPINKTIQVHGAGPYWTNLSGLEARAEYDFWLGGGCGISYHGGSACFRTDPERAHCEQDGTTSPTSPTGTISATTSLAASGGAEGATSQEQTSNGAPGWGLFASSAALGASLAWARRRHRSAR